MLNQDVMRSDADWEHFAQAEPYWAVLASDQFRRPNLNDEAKALFFESGEATVEHVFRLVRGRVDPAFAPRRVLDFGCGVGRLLIPFARRCGAAVGVDVADTMLREAKANCRAAGVTNVELVKGNDEFSAVSGSFDLVHTYLVLQHIPVERGVRIFRRLVELVAPGGCGAIHVIYWLPPAPAAPPVPVPPRSSPLRALARAVLAPLRLKPVVPSQPVRPLHEEPEMQMNVYPLNALIRILREAGMQRTHVEFDYHGLHGPDGVQLFFRREPAAA